MPLVPRAPISPTPLAQAASGTLEAKAVQFTIMSSHNPRNSTSLSLVGVFKWLAVLASAPLFLKAWQGIVDQKTAPSRGRVPGDLLTGQEAVAFGLRSLGAALVCLGVAFALWYFWQRHED